ncbi:MAG: hypothetical protein NTW75_10265 [Planctomycetales bacterium]|nr:hypothetical protein [Planctomycetales bacterium]
MTENLLLRVIRQIEGEASSDARSVTTVTGGLRLSSGLDFAQHISSGP